MDFDLLIKNGTVVTSGSVFKADVGVKNEKIVTISDSLEQSSGEVIDAVGKFIVPGGVEIHTHIDGILHGMRTVDDWFYASLGAACGGTTTIVDFIMQGKDQTLHNVIEEYKERAKDKSILDYAFTPIISKYNEETYREIPELIKEGVPSFKVFMYYDWKVDDYNLARIIDTVGSHGGICHIHCENAGTIDYLSDKFIQEGKTGVEWHAPARPESTEVDATLQVLEVAAEFNAPVVIVHMSSGQAVEELAKARAKGVKVYGETMPHFLLLDEGEYNKPGYEAMKVVITPPLRAKENQKALWNGLQSGSLVTFGSDHCAFPHKDKIRLFETRGKVFPMIPHGAPGIETRVPLLFSEGFSKGRITLSKFVELSATNPAKLAGIYPKKGTIAVGSDADIVIIDPDKKVTLSQEILHGKTDYTPYEGWDLNGYPVMSIVRGNIVVKDNEFVGEKGSGKYLVRNPFVPF
jgi:dihydropyrimidinase